MCKPKCSDIGLWRYLPRKFNTVADALSKNAITKGARHFISRNALNEVCKYLDENSTPNEYAGVLKIRLRFDGAFQRHNILSEAGDHSAGAGWTMECSVEPVPKDASVKWNLLSAAAVMVPKRLHQSQSIGAETHAMHQAMACLPTILMYRRLEL